MTEAQVAELLVTLAAIKMSLMLLTIWLGIFVTYYIARGVR